MKPYLCWHCTNSFTTRRGMNQHFRMAHGLGADGIATISEEKRRHGNRNPGQIITEELCHGIKSNNQSANTIEAANP